MVNIPLIQGNSIQEINTSIIAIKKAQKELESLNTLVDNKIKALNLALSGGSGKFIQSISQTEGQVAVEVGELTDTIASGNSQPATSNGVAGAISTEATARDNAIQNAINALDVASVGGSGKYISAISEANGKISATASDLATSATTGNANPITSGAVANILKNLVEQSNSLPTEANINVSGTFVRIYQERKSANDLSHYPSLTNFSSAGGVPAWCLFHFQVDNGRIVQICTVQYYNTSGLWRNELFCRQKIDSTWFNWKSLHSLSN